MLTNAKQALDSIKNIQYAFKVIAALQLTASLWPQDSCIQDGATFDYIIVGGGSSGCVIANRLSEDKDIKVLLIEAGGDPPLESIIPSLPLYVKGSDVDWKYATVYDKNLAKCHQFPYYAISIGKVLGGESSINYEYYSNGDYTNYLQWASITNDTLWSPDNVLPYYKKSERLMDAEVANSRFRKYHGFNGPLGVTTTASLDRGRTYNYLKGFEQVGKQIVADLNGIPSLGHAKLMITVADGISQNTAYAFLTPIKNRKNLYVMKNAMVNKIIIDKHKNARGVIVTTKCNKVITIKAREEVVVSAGPINSAKLLMLSGIGPKKHLHSKGIKVIMDLPVGKNLQDHIGVYIAIALNKLYKNPSPMNLYQYLAPSTYGHITLNKSQNFPEYESQSFYMDSAEQSLKYCVFQCRYSFNICNKLYNEVSGRDSLNSIVSNMLTKSRGVVLLRSSDPKDKPVVNPRYLSNEEDLENLVKYVKDFVKVVKSEYFKSVGAELLDLASPYCDEFKKGSIEYWKCYSTCLLYPRGRFCGTCAMGSVVDSRLRVYGVGKLRVADASIMPVITSGDVTAPTIMIGEKASDIIKEDHKQLNFDICNKVFNTASRRQSLVTIVSYLSPVSRGEVLLRNSNPMDKPLIFARYLSKDIDLENLAKYVKDFVLVLKSANFKSLGAKLVDLTSPHCDGFKKGSLEYWKCYSSCLLIPRGRFCCTCAMGSVVDSRLRVFGVGKLRVADASVMPIIVGGDTTIPTIMIGEKASDMIKEDRQNL